jgi:hypothetical protein
MEAVNGLHASIFRSYASLASAVQRSALWNRARTGRRRDSADSRCAWRQRRRRRNKKLIPLGRRRTTGHALTRKGIDIRVRSREAIRQCLQEGNDLVLLLIRQAEFTRRPVNIVRNLGHGPAVHFFGRSCRAVSGSDREWKHVARIVEVDELLQALDVAVVKELLLEVRPGRLGGGTLWRCHRHISRRRDLELAVDTWSKLCPKRIRIGGGTETASKERPHSQVSVAETKGIGGEAEEIRRGLIKQSDPGIQRQALIGRAEAGEHRVATRGIAGVDLTRVQSGSSFVEVAGIAVPFAIEQVETGLLVWRKRVIAVQERVEFRRESADRHGLLV